METHSEKQNNFILEPQLQALIKQTEETARMKELNRVVTLMLGWGIRLSDEQVKELIAPHSLY
jgi:hypothetical protein